MKQRKASIKGLFFLFLLLVLVASYVSADGVELINVNTTVTGQAAERKANVYQFSVPSNGKLNIRLRHENLFDTNVYWTVELLADDMETVLQSFDSSGTDANKIGGSIGLTQGTYYVKVYARKECSHKYSEKPYQLYVMHTPSSQWEIEYDSARKQGNNSQATSTPMTAGKYSYGTICSEKDVDYFKINLKKAGTISIEFRHPNIFEANECWNVQIVNAKTAKICELTSKGTKTKLTSPTVGVSAGTYYVRISGAQKYSDRDYQVRVIYKKTGNWEKEYTNSSNHFNNTMSTANTLSRGKWIQGTISSTDDVDFMKVSVPSSKTVTIKFAHDYYPKSTKWWKISVYNSRTSHIYSFYSRAYDKTLTKKIRLSKGTYFVKVSKGSTWTKRAYKLYVK